MTISNTLEIARHKNFRITGFKKVPESIELEQKIKDSAKKANINKNDFVHNALLNACELNNQFSDDSLNFGTEKLEEYGDLSEQDLVSLLLQNTTISELARKTVAALAKRSWQSNQEKNKDGSERKRATAVATQDKIDKLAKAQMLKNTQAENWHEKRSINSSFLQKGGKEDSMGRSAAMPNIFGFPAVKAYLDTHEEEIDQHHYENGIKGNFNQKVANELKRIAKNS